MGSGGLCASFPFLTNLLASRQLVLSLHTGGILFSFVLVFFQILSYAQSVWLFSLAVLKKNCNHQSFRFYFSIFSSRIYSQTLLVSVLSVFFFLADWFLAAPGVDVEYW